MDTLYWRRPSGAAEGINKYGVQGDGKAGKVDLGPSVCRERGREYVKFPRA